MSRQFIIQPPRPALNSDFGPSRYKVDPDPVDSYDQVSVLGTPVWSNLILLADGTTVGNPTTIDPNSGKKDLRIDTVLFTIDIPKLVQMTEITGRDGTVKEYISRGDYQIAARGSINTPYPTVFPKDDVDLFNQFCVVGSSIKVSSRLLDLLGVTDIVILNARIIEKAGYINEVDFEVTAVSDYPIEFSLNPNKGL